MSNMQRFKMKHIKENDFAQLIEDDLDEAFMEAHRQNLTKELPNGFV